MELLLLMTSTIRQFVDYATLFEVIVITPVSIMLATGHKR